MLSSSPHWKQLGGTDWGQVDGERGERERTDDLRSLFLIISGISLFPQKIFVQSFSTCMRGGGGDGGEKKKEKRVRKGLMLERFESALVL